MKSIKKFLPVILGIVAGYELTLHVFSEAIPIFIGTQGIAYPIVLYSTLIFAILLFTIIFQVIMTKRISKTVMCCLFITYFTILFATLFFRHSYESFAILNPLTGLSDAMRSWEMLVQSILNMIMFVPMGYFFKNRKLGATIIVGMIISLITETIQYMFKLGFFDTFDCLLYVAGICLGRYIFQRITVEFKTIVYK